MSNVSLSILISMLSILNKSQKHYVTISPSKFLILLKRYHGITIRDRWLRACQKKLEDEGYIRRLKRYKNQHLLKSNHYPRCLFSPSRV